MRSRRWALVVNESAKCYDTLLDLLLNLKNLSYAVILHDKDITEEGEPKKPHYHVILDYNNPHEFSAISNKFEGAHIENIKSFENAIQYLTHKNNPEKYQYRFEDIKTNNIDWLNEAYNIDIIISKRFDFNKIPEYFKEYKEIKEINNFVVFLLAKFPQDSYSIISKIKQIDTFTQLLDNIDTTQIEILKDKLF